jgi:hypothetical protein
VAQKLSLDQIQSKHDYVVFSASRGMLSEHPTATDAIKAYAAVAGKNLDTDAMIYKRSHDGWVLF